MDKLVHLRDLPVVVGGEFFYLLFVSGFGFRKMVCQFLDLLFVSGFGFRKMVCQFLDLLFVASFRLREEFAVEMLNLRDPFRNKTIHPANRPGKQLGLVRF